MTQPTRGRQLQIGHTDRTSSLRTPTEPLRLIPPAARASFVPHVETFPGLRAGENDLTRIAPGRPRAAGTVISVGGRLTDEYGRPRGGVLLEVWNANTWGRYTHGDDPAREPLDPLFAGFGRTVTAQDGSYSFLTIKPAAYLARPDINRWRPAHIHMSVIGGGSRLVTQMYFAGDEHLAIDPCFQLLGEAGSRHLMQTIEPEHPDAAYGCRFDVVVGGRSSSWFED